MMTRLIPCLMAVLLLSGCYRSMGSEDKESDAGSSGTDTNTGAAADSDSDIDSDADTDADTDTYTDTDTHLDNSCLENKKAPDGNWPPDSLAACWTADALQDNTTCMSNSDCPPGGPDDPTLDCIIELGPGQCECRDDSDCGDGICRNGVCGPSFCNGILRPSMWGGCEPMTGCATPEGICTDIDAGYPGHCCEGDYPADSTGMSLGGCSTSPDCEGF